MMVNDVADDGGAVRDDDGDYYDSWFLGRESRGHSELKWKPSGNNRFVDDESMT